MFFLMRDWERDMVEPCLLAREIEVALDIDAASFILPVVVKSRTGEPCSCVVLLLMLPLFDVTQSAYVIIRVTLSICQFLFFDFPSSLLTSPLFTISPHLYLPGPELQP